MNTETTQLYRTLAIFLAETTNKTFAEIPDEATLDNQDNLWYKTHCVKNPANEDYQFAIILSANYPSDKPTVRKIYLMNSRFDIVEILK